MKGVVFEDDSQIVVLSADKTSVIELTAYIVAIRRPLRDEKAKFKEFVYSENKFAWDDEQKIKSHSRKQFNL